ncbi:MAG: hypothetical protein JRH19_22110 [Deltaproteobacteria bacterium]|nr:hypothetical protein [Deltaproteobacteria bacterium]
MSLTVREKPASHGSFDPPPTGIHPAVCVWLVDLGTQNTNFGGQSSKKEQILIGWELPGQTRRDGKNFVVHKFYNAILSPRAALRQDLEAWRAKPFTPAELDGFDLKNILGVPCTLPISHNEKGSRVFAKVGTPLPLDRGADTPSATLQTIAYDIKDPIPDSLPDWIRKKIAASDEHLDREDGPGCVLEGEPENETPF